VTGSIDKFDVTVTALGDKFSVSVVSSRKMGEHFLVAVSFSIDQWKGAICEANISIHHFILFPVISLLAINSISMWVVSSCIISLV
jgi:hypothetical protein